MVTLMRLICELSQLFIWLVDAARVTDEGESIPEAVQKVIYAAGNASGHWDQAKEEWDKFYSDVEPTAQKIAAVMGNG
jgi:hypothetical protein